MIIDLAEVKTYLKTNFTFEDEKVLEETAKGLKRVLENTVYGGIVYNGNIFSISEKEGRATRDRYTKGYIELK